MVAIVDRLLLKIETDVNNTLSSFDKFNQRINNARKRMDLFERATNAGLKGTDKLTKRNAASIAAFEKAQEKAQARIQGLQAGLMGAGLSFLFTGMAIKNFFQGMLKSLLQTFLLVEGQQGPVNERINELTASLAFLQFAFIDAFAQSGIFDALINNLISIVDSLANMDPAVQTFIVGLMVTLFVLAAILMVVGQMMLGFLGIIALVWAGLAPVFFIIMAVIIAIIALISIWSSDMSTAEKVMWTIVTVLLVIGVILLLTVGWIGLIVIAIALAIGAIVMFRKQIALAFLKAGAAIRDGFISMINWAIEKLNHLIELANKIPGVNIGMIGAIGTETVESGLDNKIASLEADIANDKAQKEAQAEEGKEEGGMMSSVTNVFNIEGDLVTEDERTNSIMESIGSKQNFGNGSPQRG